MPKLDQSLLHSVFYLYETQDDARAGKNPQATGFVMAVPIDKSSPYGAHQAYFGVSNWHAAVQKTDDRNPAPVVRLNKKDGGVDVLQFRAQDWYFTDDGPDVAFVPIEPSDEHNIAAIPSIMFATKETLRSDEIGVGDDVFMLGLFVDSDGTTQNVPCARFGNISQMPNRNALINHETGYSGEIYVIDMHSRDGFSGSPVFVYRTLGSDLSCGMEDQLKITVTEDQRFRNSRRGEPHEVQIEARAV